MSGSSVPADRLVFSEDLAAWRAWHENAHALRRWRATARERLLRLRGGAAPRGTDSAAPLVLSVRGEHPRVLFAVDATTPTQIASVLRPLTHLTGTDVAVVSVGPVLDGLAALGERTTAWRIGSVPADPLAAPAPDLLTGVRTVTGVGHYLPAGRLAHAWAGALGARFVVVQHGLLTPFAPPLPPDALLAAFSAADAAFYAAGRTDVSTRVVGSQLLWEASRPARQAPSSAAGHRPVFLGQLHGAELPRADFARAAMRFCTRTGAVYRPHPGERDRVSRAIHALWRARGLTVGTDDAALAALDAPVASVFSTGVLEAAARGLPAVVTHPNPPAWVSAFWHRYGMARWDGSTAWREHTPSPWVPETEPARAVAALLTDPERESESP